MNSYFPACFVFPVPAAANFQNLAKTRTRFGKSSLLENKPTEHPTYGLGKVRTTSGSGYNPQNRRENHETEEMGIGWARAAVGGNVVYGVALCGCGSLFGVGLVGYY